MGLGNVLQNWFCFQRQNCTKIVLSNETFWVDFQVLWGWRGMQEWEVPQNDAIFKSFSFPPKMGFEERRKFDGTCNYQNCNLWSNPVIIHMAILKGVCIFAYGVRLLCIPGLRPRLFVSLQTSASGHQVSKIYNDEAQINCATFRTMKGERTVRSKRKLAACSSYATLTKKNHFLLPSMTFMTWA